MIQLWRGGCNTGLRSAIGGIFVSGPQLCWVLASSRVDAAGRRHLSAVGPEHPMRPRRVSFHSGRPKWRAGVPGSNFLGGARQQRARAASAKGNVWAVCAAREGATPLPSSAETPTPPVAWGRLDPSVRVRSLWATTQVIVGHYPSLRRRQPRRGMGTS